MTDKCPFCGLDPYEYVDIGIGQQAVAVNCCEYGYRLLVDGEDEDKLRQEADREAEERAELFEPLPIYKGHQILVITSFTIGGPTRSTAMIYDPSEKVVATCKGETMNDVIKAAEFLIDEMIETEATK